MAATQLSPSAWARDFVRTTHDVWAGEAAARAANPLIAAQEQRGLVMSASIRIAMILVILAWMNVFGVESTDYVFLYEIGPLSAFLILGIAELVVFTRHVEWVALRYVFAVSEAVLLAFVVAFYDPLQTGIPNHPARLHDPLYIFFGFLVLTYAFSLSPRVVAVSGVSSVLAWLVAVVKIGSSPLSQFDALAPFDGTTASLETNYSNPYIVPVPGLTLEGLFLAFTVLTLTIVVTRLRGLALNLQSAESQRLALARYFPPQIVNDLMSADAPLSRIERRDVALLFIDIRGFTPYCERVSPEESLALLRDFHARMQTAVFAHGGMVEKYVGDALFAVFGVPDQRPTDAAAALACARDMIGALELWNAERSAGGHAEIRAGIGLHYGPAVMGDIGGEQQHAFTVVGDAVNTASRLEQLTKSLGARVVASAAFMDALRHGAIAAPPSDFASVAPQIVEGKAQALDVWVLPS
ncbi:MAG: adenylate/guanylate cyclase domain-containing protein [Alphaproteobacteria bacterium]|nr:adenylate/guanylate cyclase domain-containing protein [Alphaproteobacteria bacterium]